MEYLLSIIFFASVLGRPEQAAVLDKLPLARRERTKMSKTKISSRVELKSVTKVASQSIPTSNQIISWLREMETLRQIAA